ncbi:Zn-ribbon domain-containing OB-fold protein [Arvimicrobium flavum]|uniref:Zn-ribbon domain-containing OB-fold protein n=1 Tax=Arvimicrobium flavum TaxID=3393320 RepID=UPI00237B9218|nr:Zn-ribbon domain-containing OB-fold protein [Mesorhizobium shangrilense]
MSVLSSSLHHHPETQPFWSALGERRFLFKACRGCGRAHWYPRAICPFCDSPDTEWRNASGRGVIYSYSIMRVAKPPYAIAYVTLEEGPTMMTNIVDSDLEAIAIGKPVEVAIRKTTDDESLPMFKLA